MPVASFTLRWSHLIVALMWVAAALLLWAGATHHGSADLHGGVCTLYGIYLTAAAATCTVCTSIRLATIRVLAAIGRLNRSEPEPRVPEYSEPRPLLPVH